jgi:hypothetical protein
MLRRAAHFVFRESLALHIMLTVVMAGISIVLLSPGETFHSSPSYAWFLQHWPYTDDRWGLIFGAGAWVGVIGIVSPNRWIKLFSVVVLGVCHTTFAEGIWKSNPISTGIVPYGTLAIASLYLILKLGWEERR